MITLKKNNDYFTFGIGKAFIPLEESLIPYLSDDIAIEDGVTFGQFFNIILKHHEEYSEVFSSYTGDTPLSNFIGEWNSKLINKKKEYDYVCIRWGITVVSPDKLLNHSVYINKIPEFVGLESKQKVWLDGGYSLEYTPINELKEVKLTLVPDNKIINGDTLKPIINLDRKFTVFDVLASVFSEITSVGTPKERQESFDRLAKKIEKSIKNMPSVKDGDTINLNEFLRKLKIDPPKE